MLPLLLDLKLTRPALRALDGIAPLLVRGIDVPPVCARLEPPVQSPGLAQVVGRLPHSRTESGEERRTERSGLDDLRALHGYAELVGLDLTQEIVRARATVDGQRGQGRHRVDDIAHLEGDRIQRGADDV